MKDEQLDALFAQVRQESVVTPYPVLARRFLRSSGVGPLGVWLGLFLRKCNPLKCIVMTTSTLIVALVGTLYLNSNAEQPQDTAHSLRSESHAPNAGPQSEHSALTIYTQENKILLHTEYNPEDKVNTLHAKPVEFIPLQLQTLDTVPLHKSYKADGEQKERLFWITRNMEDRDLRAIQEAAGQAGIDFNFRILVWNARVKKCTFWMKYTDKDGAYCEYQSELKGNFRKRIGWLEDAEGRATALITD